MVLVEVVTVVVMVGGWRCGCDGRGCIRVSIRRVSVIVIIMRI